MAFTHRRHHLQRRHHHPRHLHPPQHSPEAPAFACQQQLHPHRALSLLQISPYV